MGSITPPPPPSSETPTSAYAPRQNAYTYSTTPSHNTTPSTLQHPPGYVQNPYADAMSPAARAVQAQQDRRQSVLAGLAEAVGVSSSAASNDSGGGMMGDGGMGGGGAGGAGDEGAWGAAKKWMGGVADAAVAVEGEVWRRFSTSR